MGCAPSSSLAVPPDGTVPTSNAEGFAASSPSLLATATPAPATPAAAAPAAAAPAAAAVAACEPYKATSPDGDSDDKSLPASPSSGAVAKPAATPDEPPTAPPPPSSAPPAAAPAAPSSAAPPPPSSAIHADDKPTVLEVDWTECSVLAVTLDFLVAFRDDVVRACCPRTGSPTPRILLSATQTTLTSLPPALGADGDRC